jgi:hypothetical protein
MTQEAKASTLKGDRKTLWLSRRLHAERGDNWLDTGVVCPARKGADVGQVSW